MVEPRPPPPSPATDSSSPSHEFSFTAISFSKTSPPPPGPQAAVDLSPADEIFFHGHLLPLHLLSHLPPRASTDTVLPGDRNYDAGDLEDLKQKQTTKPQFSLFRIPAKWRLKQSEPKPDDAGDCIRRKSKFDAVWRYLRLIRPRFLLRKGNKNTEYLRHQQCSSYSGNLRLRSSVDRKWTTSGSRGGECYASAPATMGNSPTNSGVLAAAVGSGTMTPTAAKSDSTMEELQAAIQAAIAHCKNSIANYDDVM